jgi:hypothetical protein
VIFLSSCFERKQKQAATMVDWQYLNILSVMFSVYMMFPVGIAALIYFNVKREFDLEDPVFYGMLIAGFLAGYIALGLSPGDYLDPNSNEALAKEHESCSCKALKKPVQFKK